MDGWTDGEGRERERLTDRKIDTWINGWSDRQTVRCLDERMVLRERFCPVAPGTFTPMVSMSEVQALPGQAETGRTTFVHLECIRIGEDVKSQKEHVCLKQIAQILKDSSWKWLAPSAMCYPDLAQDSSRGAQSSVGRPCSRGPRSLSQHQVPSPYLRKASQGEWL